MKGKEPEYDFSQGRRGPVVASTAGKARITIRLDQDILEWFKKKVNEAGGGNYQTLINRLCGNTSNIATASWRRPCAG